MENEYGVLEKVIVSEPQYMRITEIINEVQKKYAKENIDTTAALKQHRAFVKTLKNEGVEVLYLHNHKELNEQVFTRDLGFVVDKQLCVSNLKVHIRKKETDFLIQMLNKQKLDYYEFQHEIEGGDVLVHQNTIFIGINNRTTMDAVKEIKQKFPSKQVDVIQLTEGILHLDCVFNIIDEQTALIYKDGIDQESFLRMKQKFNLILITKDEQEKMASNVLSIGNRKIITLFNQERINTLLKRRGFTVMEHDLSEIIKSGGAFRCCTFPIIRR
ncbi:dimethylarginine dimethylaminohydrolase family protein [Alkalihalobacillus sp. 1P02AB]|uniref:dimethylarginine dimethylaminohydrolase family protein n=1 Tax=Alkalihalobacillus sp. 1P02AB TaxID=3132260 RepID=UPI0039A47E75